MEFQKAKYVSECGGVTWPDIHFMFDIQTIDEYYIN